MSAICESDPFPEENAELSVLMAVLGLLKGIESPLETIGTRPKTHTAWSKSSTSMPFKDSSVIQVLQRKECWYVSSSATSKSLNMTSNPLAQEVTLTKGYPCCQGM